VNKENGIYMSWCIRNGIKIVPVPIVSNGSVCKLLLINESKPKSQRERLGEEKYKAATVHEKIYQMYKAIFEKNNKK